MSKQPRDHSSKAKRPRLIVRNLSFKATAEDLTAAFSPFGDLVDVKIVQDGEGKSKGFGFVQYATMPAALKAMSSLTGTKLKNRNIAVDLALAKNVYEESLEDFATAKENESGTAAEEAESSSDERDSDSESECDKEEEDDNEEDDEENDDEEDDDEEEEEEEEGEKVVDPPSESSRAEELPRTVFLRNLNFETESSAIFHAFKKFGRLEKVLLVRDRYTQRPRGTAFVRFKNRDDAFKCVSSCAETPVEIDGRQVTVNSAVNKSRAQEFQEEGKQHRQQKREDKRNLYLADEGHIPPESPAFAELSATDQQKRKATRADKLRKLKNPNFSVSRTRLSIRNLPRDLDEKGLKTLCITALKPAATEEVKNKRIVQVKLVRDPERIVQGVPRSKCYGFVQFSEHDAALFCLRQLNNNPSTFTANKRPIVEFAVDNVQKVRKHQQIESLGAKKNPSATPGAVGSENNSSNKSKRRSKQQQQQQQKQKKQNINSSETDATTTATAAAATAGTANAQAKSLTHQEKRKARKLFRRQKQKDRKAAKTARKQAAETGTTTPTTTIATPSPATQRKKRSVEEVNESSSSSTGAVAASSVDRTSKRNKFNNKSKTGKGAQQGNNTPVKTPPRSAPQSNNKVVRAGGTPGGTPGSRQKRKPADNKSSNKQQPNNKQQSNTNNSNNNNNNNNQRRKKVKTSN